MSLGTAKRPVTVNVLAAVLSFEAAILAAVTVFLVAETAAQRIAAQPASTVPEKTQPAAPTDRTAAASKLLDGSGPGADRRPASSTLTGDALLRSQIAESMSVAKGN